MKFSSPIPTRVVVFRDKGTFDRFKTIEWAAGYFQPGEDVNYIVLPAEGETGNFQTIFHEYTHFLIDNSLGRAKAPPWFNEGIAEFYEPFSIENDQRVTLGSRHEGNLQILQRQPFIPFETFFATDYYTLHKQTRESAQLFYAQSWALLHYLLQGNGGARRERFDKFVDLLVQGTGARVALQQAFEMDFAALETELKAYVAQKNFAATVVNFKEKLVFDAEMQIFAVAESEAKAYQGDCFITRKGSRKPKNFSSRLCGSTRIRVSPTPRSAWSKRGRINSPKRKPFWKKPFRRTRKTISPSTITRWRSAAKA
jgi:hypothetical protein